MPTPKKHSLRRVPSPPKNMCTRPRPSPARIIIVTNSPSLHLPNDQIPNPKSHTHLHLPHNGMRHTDQPSVTLHVRPAWQDWNMLQSWPTALPGPPPGGDGVAVTAEGEEAGGAGGAGGGGGGLGPGGGWQLSSRSFVEALYVHMTSAEQNPSFLWPVPHSRWRPSRRRPNFHTSLHFPLLRCVLSVVHPLNWIFHKMPSTCQLYLPSDTFYTEVSYCSSNITATFDKVALALALLEVSFMAVLISDDSKLRILF